MPNDTPPAKAGWERFVASPLFTAVVGLIGTGLIGNLVVASYQSRIRTRELAQLAYKEYVGSELTTIKDAYKLLGSYLSATEDLIVITGPAFNPRSYAAEQRADIEKQKVAMRADYNKLDAKWREERDSLGMLIAYYHHGRRDIASSWYDVTGAVDAYNACALKWSFENPEARQRDLDAGPCGNERRQARERVQKFTELLESSRRLIWKEWGITE